jgi:hypothetical protein
MKGCASCRSGRGATMRHTHARPESRTHPACRVRPAPTARPKSIPSSSRSIPRIHLRPKLGEVERSIAPHAIERRANIILPQEGEVDAVRSYAPGVKAAPSGRTGRGRRSVQACRIRYGRFAGGAAVRASAPRFPRLRSARPARRCRRKPRPRRRIGRRPGSASHLGAAKYPAHGGR